MRLVKALFLLLEIFLPVYGLDPRKSLAQYSSTIWAQQHGLPQDTIRAIAQTPEGFLWVGTDEGLARFDGYEFVVHNQENNNLPGNSITSLASAADGSLWIGTSKGIAQLRDGQLRSWTIKDGLAEGPVSSLFVDHLGNLWVVAGGNLSRFDGRTFTNFVKEKDLPMRSARGVAEDGKHDLYVAGISSVAKFVGGKFRDAIDPNALAADFPTGISADREGNLWIVGVRGIVRRSPNGALTRFPIGNGKTDLFGLSNLTEDRDGNLWVGTLNGVARLEGGQFRGLGEAGVSDPTSETFRSGSVQALFEDRDGNLWAGGSNGLLRLRDDRFVVYRKSEGLPSDEPNTVFEDRSGRTWIGFLDGGIALMSGSGVRSLAGQAGMPKGRVFAIRETHDGELLVSSRDGLTRIRDGHARLIVPPDPHGRKTVYDAIEKSPAGALLLATTNGIVELDGTQFRTVVPGGPMLEDSAFVALLKGKDGTIWAGSMRRGLWSVASDGRIRRYTMKDGLGSDQIRSLYQEPDGTLWVSTLEGGLNLFRDGKFLSFRAKDGLLSDNVASVIDDGASFWISTTRGISEVSKTELLDFANHRAAKLNPVNYGMADGLPSAQCAPSLGAGGGRHADGTLWFVTSRGIAVYNRQTSRHLDAAPQIQFTETTSGGREMKRGSNPQVPPDGSRLRIRYAGIYLRAPDLVQYSYKLDGLDSDWVNSGNRRTVDYTSLRHGPYVFHVRAEVPGGSSSEASFGFEMLPHLYETVWFRSLGVLFVLALAWLAYHLRVRQVRYRFALVLDERARLAREIHDTLAQAFVGIASQLDALETCMPENAQPARGFLDIARRMARHSLTEARRAVMDLRTTALDDQDLAAALDSGARGWTVGSGLDVKVDLRGDASKLPENVAHHVLRIAQEAISNVLKHARATKVALNLSVDKNQLQMKIADNGCGFDSSGAFATAQGHFGLIGMRERAKRVGGKLAVEAKPGSGTEVELTVPLG